MNRTIRTITALAVVLSMSPAVAADPIEDVSRSLTECAPPVGLVPYDAKWDVEVCGEIHGACTYEVVPDRLDPFSGGSWGADVHLERSYAYGYSTMVHCKGLAQLRSVHQGTLGGEIRGADLRLGLVVDNDVIEGSPAAREAAMVYAPETWAFLELELEVEAFAVYRDAVPVFGHALLSVPIAMYDSHFVPQLWATDAIAPPATLALEHDMTRSVPLIRAGAQ